MKTRKGGQKVRTNQLNMELPPICEHRFDCGASVFYMLGYANLETSRYLARRSPRGLYNITEVLPMLNLAYNNVRWDPVTAIDNLNPNEATMAEILFEGQTTGHYFILYRTDEPFLYVLDPQMRVNAFFDDYLQMFSTPMIRLNYINSENVIDVGAHRVTREIIDTILGPLAPFREPTEDEDLSLPGEGRAYAGAQDLGLDDLGMDDLGLDEDMSQYGALPEDPSMTN